MTSYIRSTCFTSCKPRHIIQHQLARLTWTMISTLWSLTKCWSHFLKYWLPPMFDPTRSFSDFQSPSFTPFQHRASKLFICSHTVLGCAIVWKLCQNHCLKSCQVAARIVQTSPEQKPREPLSYCRNSEQAITTKSLGSRSHQQQNFFFLLLY